MSFNEFGFTRASVAYHPFTGRLIPTDTPVYMPFTEGEMGVLMVEGTTNLLQNPSFETGDLSNWYWGTGYGITGKANIVTNPTWHGNYAVKITITDSTSTRDASVKQNINVASGVTVTLSAYLLELQGNVNAEIIFRCNNGSGGYQHLNKVFTTPGYCVYTATIPDGYIADQVWLSIRPRSVGGIGYGIFDAIQLEQKPYPTPFHPGTRADPAMIAVRSNLPPAEFGVGIAFKPWWDSETYDLLDYRTIFVMGADASNNAVRAMRYRGYWDLRIFAGGVGAYHRIERSFNAGEIMGFYLEKRGDQGKVYYVQENGESFESDWFTVGALFTSDDIKRMYLGTHFDGASRWAGGIIADYVFQTLLDGIDPIGYLSQIGKPKVTAVVGEEVESIPGSQLRDGLFREIPRVFSKPAAVSIAPGVFYQEVDLGNWAAGLRVYASEDMVMFIAGREIEIPKSVLLYLPWKVRTFEVRQKSAAAVGTLYIYGGC